MLHQLCALGEAELLAVTACYTSPYVAGCIDAINRYCNREVPVGINYSVKNEDGGVYAGPLCTEFSNRYPAETYGTPNAAPDTLHVLREILAHVDDHSITLTATGFIASLARLVQSPADDISKKTGRELIEHKVLRTVIMGGRFFGTWPMPMIVGSDCVVRTEWNIKADIQSSQIMFRE